MFKKFRAELDNPATLKTAGALLSTSLVAIAGVIAAPEQMTAVLTAMHFTASPVSIALACAVISSILHRYSSPPNNTP